MAITATTEGRNLHLTVEGIDDPYVIRPLPGNAGMQITDTYLRGATGQADQEEITAALCMALDGAAKTDEGWVPIPEDDRVNSTRIGDELSIGETEDVSMAAFFWQTILSDAGVNLYLSSGGGVEGHTKAMWALVTRLGLSPLLTSPSSALEDLIQLLGSTPSTSSPAGGRKPGKQPQDRLPKRKNAPAV